MTIRSQNRNRSRIGQLERGGVLAGLAHVLLIMLILGQVVYLASRHRVRWDLTSDKLWSVTDSTKDIIGGLEKQLLIEAYFSPKEKLPVTHRVVRDVLDNFLDELVQLGRGKVVLQLYDPNSDKAISDRCTRIGVKPIDLRAGTSTSVSLDRHWLGLRFVYGGSKQKVLSQALAQSSFVAEALITPAVKEVVTDGKRKFGYMEWPVTMPGQPQGIGWNTLRTHEGIVKRYEFQNLKNEDAPLLGDDLDTLFLYRPNDLSDREKYVIDQFVVKGGTLVVFADAADYAIGQRRQFNRNAMVIDKAGSEKPFFEQLRHYGIDWKPKVLADMFQQAHSPRNLMQPQEYLAAPENTRMGLRMISKTYPYFFHAVNYEWSQAAEQLARDPKTGEIDQAEAESYRQFVPGIPGDEFLFTPFKKIGRGPGFYWPTWVGLRTKAGGEVDLPTGVEGKVLLWSSPAVLVEDAPPMLNPFGFGDARAQHQSYMQFVQKLNERVVAEPRQQAPLMAEVSGAFTSFFAGGERPLRPSEIREAEARAAEKAAEEAADQAKDADSPDGAQPDGAKPGEAKPGEEKPQRVGPEPPPELVRSAKDKDKAAAPAAPEPDMVAGGDEAGRIVIVGDSDFIRDDLVSQTHAQAGGPVSVLGPAFFSNMLDWLAEDRDLVALQSRVTTDRTLKFIDDLAPGTDPRTAEQQMAAKTGALRSFNVIFPVVLLLVFGALVFVFRRAQKRTFLESVA